MFVIQKSELSFCCLRGFLFEYYFDAALSLSAYHIYVSSVQTCFAIFC